MKVRSTLPKVQVVCPLTSRPESEAASAIASANFGRSGAFSASRSLPSATTVPASPSTLNVGRRCPGTFDQSQASRGTTTPVLPRRNRSSASSSDSSPGDTEPRKSLAKFGAGTKFTRSCLGSDRISAVTSSCRNPGTCQVNGSGSTWFSVATGTSTVTPSRAAPGSNW